MRSKKFSTVLLILAIVFGIIASTTAVKVVEGFRHVTTVIRVNKDIQPFTQLTDKDIETAQVPTAAVTAESITDSKKVINKYSRTYIPKGSILDENQLANTQNTQGGAALPLTEMNNTDIRAIGIPEDFVHVLGDNLKDQDHVDLVGVFMRDKESFARTIAYGVPVLKKNGMDKGGGIVVAVSAKQAEEIALAMNYGRLVVSLTPYKFDSKPQPGTYLDSILLSTKNGANSTNGGTGK